MQRILLPLQQVMLWTEIRPAELTALQAALQLPVKGKRISTCLGCSFTCLEINAGHRERGEKETVKSSGGRNRGNVPGIVDLYPGGCGHGGAVFHHIL